MDHKWNHPIDEIYTYTISNLSNTDQSSPDFAVLKKLYIINCLKRLREKLKQPIMKINFIKIALIWEKNGT